MEKIDRWDCLDILAICQFQDDDPVCDTRPVRYAHNPAFSHNDTYTAISLFVACPGDLVTQVPASEYVVFVVFFLSMPTLSQPTQSFLSAFILC